MYRLELRAFSVAFSERVVLHAVDLSLPRQSLSVLVGPSGGGKSTLLRTLAGLNDGHPSMVVNGEVLVDGVPYENLSAIPAQLRPGLVRQNVRFLIDTVRENLAAALPNRSSLRINEQDELIIEHLEQLELADMVGQLATSVADLSIVAQRLLALARITLANPSVLLIDEATAELSETDAACILQHIRQQAAQRAVLFVTHNQQHARAAGGTTWLLCGGTIVSSAPTQQFFDSPPNPLAKQFVATGGCRPDVAAQEANSAEMVLAPAEPSTHEVDQIPVSISIPPESAARGPRHFYWVLRGRLGGLPRPGVFQDVEHDLDALERVKITTVVTLEEWESVPHDQVEKRGMELLHFPIDDMKAPSLQAARELCSKVELRLQQKGVVALHCRAGNGRTGTMLAAQLIFQNTPACDALERVRSVNPKAVESEAQVRFLEAFERYMKGDNPMEIRG